MLAASAVLALALTSAGPARAAQAGGQASLEYVQGRVTVSSQGQPKDGRVSAVLRSGDTVITGRDGTAVILMPDGSRLKLKEFTNVTLTLPSGDGGEIGARLLLGGVFARVAKQVAGRTFRIRAGDAVASVRGTRFFTAFGRPAARGRDLWVCVNEGLVEVGAKGSQEARAVRAGQGVLIKAGRDLTAPQRYDWTGKLNWNMDPARGAVEDTVDLDKAYADPLDQDYR